MVTIIVLRTIARTGAETAIEGFRTMDREATYRAQISRLLLCIGWVLATMLALYQSVLLSQTYYRAWHDTSYFLLFAPLLLAIWELPLICLHIYWVVKSWKTALIRGLLWSFSILSTLVLFLPLIFSILWITPLGFVIVEILIGFLQSRVIKSFSSFSMGWPLIRISAFIIATLLSSIFAQQSNYSHGEVFSIVSVLSLPSGKDALLMGLMGGLIKGVGFVYILRLSPRK